MQIVAIGGRSFVTGFRLAGIQGVEVNVPQEALRKITEMMGDRSLGLIIISEEVAKPIREKLNEIRAKQSVPLIYEIPAPGSSNEKVEYRTLIKYILKV